MSLFRKILMTLMVISGIGSTISAGTFASYTASTTQQTSTFASGSLVLSRKVGSQSACFSTGAGTNTDTNANTGCGFMFEATEVKIGDSPTVVDLTITNEGTLAGTLSYRTDGCLSDTNGQYYNGVADLCQKLNVTIQEYTTSFGGPLSSCVYPSLPASACPALVATLAPTHLPSGLPTAATSLGTIGAATSRWFRLSIQHPNTGLGAADGTQGREASIKVTWSLST